MSLPTSRSLALKRCTHRKVLSVVWLIECDIFFIAFLLNWTIPKGCFVLRLIERNKFSLRYAFLLAFVIPWTSFLFFPETWSSSSSNLKTGSSVDNSDAPLLGSREVNKIDQNRVYFGVISTRHVVTVRLLRLFSVVPNLPSVSKNQNEDM
jgi:hypothetical protein